MSFDLLANPFAVLGLATDVTVREAAARARDLGTPEAAAASRNLIIPNARLHAELRFLPNISAARVGEILAELRRGRRVDPWDVFGALARANLVAHLASNGCATVSDLQLLVGLQGVLERAATEALEVSREASGLPPLASETIASGLEGLRGEHATVLAERLMKPDAGPGLLVGFLHETNGSDVARRSFLTRTTSAWERATASQASMIVERAEVLERRLLEDPGPDAARQISEVIGEWAEIIEPSRVAARVLALPAEADRRIEGWRKLAIAMVRDHGAAQEACEVLEALVTRFASDDEVSRRIVADRDEVVRRVARGEGSPQMRRLAAAIRVIETAPTTAEFAMARDRRSWKDAPAPVIEVRNAFLASTEAVASDLPWTMLRALTLKLWNDHDVRGATALLVDVGLRRARQKPQAAGDALALFEEDHRNLLSQLLNEEIKAAVAAKRWGRSRRALAELVPLTTDPVERKELAGLLRKARISTAVAFGRRGFWTVFVCFIAYGAALDALKPHHDQVASTPSIQAPTPVARSVPGEPPPLPAVSPASSLPVPVAAPPAPLTTTRPASDGSVLTIENLRWCEFRIAGAAAAKAHLETMRAYADVSRFNVAVVGYNNFFKETDALCLSRQYYVEDEARVRAQVASIKVDIDKAGVDFIDKMYAAAPPRAAPSVSSTPDVPPEAPGAPGAPPTDGTNASPTLATQRASFAEGQAARRNWEAWFSGLTGSERLGADWWASVRSLKNPPSCTVAPGASDPAYVAGCQTAQARLALSDLRRHTDKDYRDGWNEP